MASWVALDVATGYETRVAPALAAQTPGWKADRWGNLVLRVGSGTPRRVVACALDRPSLAVSQIRDNGYLRVHRIGRGSRHPLWDQAFEAQQIRVLTPDGPVAGVVARSNGHFAQQHRNETGVVGADDLWVDVGATSAEDVSQLGIRLLDPGSTARRIHSVDTFVSSDTPLESPHFAYAPPGDGPVLRAIESSSVSPNQGLSWPGRYSHSPGEVLDLRDLANLSELILVLAFAAE